VKYSETTEGDGRRQLGFIFIPFFTRDSCTGRYCWERVLAMGILSVCLSVCHDPVRIRGQVR